MKRLLPMFFIMSLLLSACTDSAKPPSNQSIDNIEEVKLTMFAASTPEHQTFVYNAENLSSAKHSSELPINLRVKQFVKEHPNVTVEIRPIVDWTVNNIPTKNSTSEKLAQNADIVEVAPNELIWGNPQLYEDLDVHTDSTLLKGDYYKLAQHYRVQSRLLALPISCDPQVLYYDREKFKQAGVPTPTGNWNWDDFGQAASKLRSAEVLTDVIPNLLWLESMIKAFGGTYISPDRTTFTGYLDSPVTIAAMEKIKQMPLEWKSEQYRFDNRARIGMGVDYLDAVPPFNDKDRFSIASLPLATDGTNPITMRTSGLAISKTSKHKEWAWKLLSFIIGGDNERAFDFAATNTYERSVGGKADGAGNPDSITAFIKKTVPVAQPSAGQYNAVWLYIYYGPEVRAILSEGANIPLQLTGAASIMDVTIAQRWSQAKAVVNSPAPTSVAAK